MKKYLKWISELLLWLLIVVAVVSLIIFVRALNVNSQYTYHAFFQDVDGLKKGSPVRLMGMQVGYISDIRPINNTVFATFIITEPNLTLPSGCAATTEFFGLGGSKSLEIYPPDHGDKISKHMLVARNPVRVATFMKLTSDMAISLIDMGYTVTHFVKDDDLAKYQNLIIKNSDLKNMNEVLDKTIIEEDKLLNRLKKQKETK